MSRPGGGAELLTDRQVDIIATRLAQRLTGAATDKADLPTARSRPVAAPRAALGEGVFANVDDAVAAAGVAFRELDGMTLEARQRIIASIRESMFEHAEELAHHAHRETGLGRPEHKAIKNRLVTRKTAGTETLTAQAVTGDNGLTLTEYAPYGVIGAITPTTNPTSTIICNTIAMLSAGNSIVFNVHPNARECSMENVRLLHRAIVAAGGPDNLVTTVAEPTIESAQALMTHKGVRILAVTGGSGVVRQAMTSGKRAICAGPGNPPVVVDTSADLELAGKGIVAGASFDNNIVCTDEKEVIAVETIVEDLLEQMREHGAYVLSERELHQVERAIFSEHRGPRKRAVVEKDLIGRNAGEILARAGIASRGDPLLLVARVSNGHPLVWTEQMMPVIPVTAVPDVDRGIELAKEAEHGFGHSAGMYSRDIEALSKMARTINTSIFTKNGPFYAGLGEGGEGHCSFTIASPTGEGLTGPIAFSRLRRCVLVDHFRIV
ncbi:MAG: aldehyde dehydrogenase EutE [Gammaproteobacteria bacterium]|nr:aldehyde dehydrogenase EutE [Gammaproteobacteria bacterium]MDH3372387.1 aldehyde dehydrogenase EutE [Gammaproteobacteria bacterium]MDH3410245.1 aldehyde dehydrogenase EutE [Gammaproteobacteria bacterium]